MQKKDTSKAVKFCHPHLDQYGNQLSGAVGVRKYASCTSLLPPTHGPSPKWELWLSEGREAFFEGVNTDYSTYKLL
jgi:hypothetical protein